MTLNFVTFFASWQNEAVKLVTLQWCSSKWHVLFCTLQNYPLHAFTLQTLIKKKSDLARQAWHKNSLRNGIFPAFPWSSALPLPSLCWQLPPTEENIILARAARLYPETVSAAANMTVFSPDSCNFDEWTLSRRPASCMRRHLRWERIWVCFSGLRLHEKWWGCRRQTEKELPS